MPRRGLVISVAVASALGVLPVVASASGASAAPYCGITWGSLAKSSSPMVAGPITNVRSGQHACYDRLVIDLLGKAPGYEVRYVTNVFTEGAGALVPLRGGAKLLVVAKAPAYGTGANNPANPKELVNVTGYRTFRQVASGGSFEGQTTIGLGVRARLPFRTFTITDTTGSRVVIDVAHAW
ncbi:MAG: hypothetical protein ABI131_03070 [Nostocoides sp.]